MANWVADLKQFCSEKNEKDSFQGIETFYSMDAKNLRSPRNNLSSIKYSRRNTSKT